MTQATLSSSFSALVSSLLEHFEKIAPETRRVWCEGLEKTPVELLADTLGWWRLLLEKTDPNVRTSAPDVTEKGEKGPLAGFTWDDTDALHLAFEDRVSHLEDEQLARALAEAGAALGRLAARAESKGFAPGCLPLPATRFLTALARHRLQPNPEDLRSALSLFLLEDTRARLAALQAWEKAARDTRPLPPHALWWY